MQLDRKGLEHLLVHITEALKGLLWVISFSDSSSRSSDFLSYNASFSCDVLLSFNISTSINQKENLLPFFFSITRTGSSITFQVVKVIRSIGCGTAYVAINLNSN